MDEYDPDREREWILYFSDLDELEREEQERRDRLDDYAPVEGK